MSAEPVAVHLLDKEYLVACTPEERPGLLAAAGLLDSKMRDVRNAARSASLDRVAVLAALNLAHELLAQRTQVQSSDGALNHDVGLLRAKLDAAMLTFVK
jgi:cell division protein ZapA